MHSRDLLKEVITDLGNHIRKNRMGLPLLSHKPEKKKENAAERAIRETREGLWTKATFDHVYWFQQHSAHYDTDDQESNSGEEADVVDQDELNALEREVLEGADRASDDSSSSDDEERASKSSKNT